MSIKLIDVKSGGIRGDELNWHTSDIRCIQASPLDNVFASGDDGKVKLWDVKNKTQTSELSGHDKYKSVMSVSFSPDGKLLASGSKDYTVRIWQLS